MTAPALAATRSAALPYRWVMLAVVWLAYASFGLVSGSIAPLIGPITRDLAISYSQMGTILGAWQLTYIGVAYTAGAIIDRFGLRRALGVGIVLIATSALLRGLAVGYWDMFLFVALFGVGGPMISIGAPKLIATWFEGAERGTAAGIYTTGPSLGTIIVLSTANSVVLPATGSWRLTIATYGLIALVVAAAWWLLARDRPRSGAPVEAFGASAVRLLRVRNVALVLAIGFASFLSGHSVNNWLPRILQSHGFDPTSAGYWASIPNAVGILGALVLPRLIRPRDRAVALVVMFATSAVALALIGLTTGAPLLLGLVLQGFVRNSITPFLMLVLMETPAVGAAAMGAAGGLYFTIGEIGGFSGPTAMGIIFDLTGGFGLGLIALAALMALMSAACLALDRPRST